MTAIPSQASSLPAASFHALTSKLAARLNGAGFALQIGAMDGVRFDMLNRHLASGNWNGLLVEPLPDMFELLRRTYAATPQVRLDNCAVADRDGAMMIRRVDPAAIAAGLLPEEALGISTGAKEGALLTDPRFAARFPEVAAKYLHDVEVPCVTLATLLARHGVARIDLVMIDTEGADWLIARQIDLERYRPALLCIEHSNLTAGDSRACLDHFTDHGYQAAICAEDAENFLFYV